MELGWGPRKKMPQIKKKRDKKRLEKPRQDSFTGRKSAAKRAKKEKQSEKNLGAKKLRRPPKKKK